MNTPLSLVWMCAGARHIGYHDLSPMSIYRHVRDRDELLVLLLDKLAAELPRLKALVEGLLAFA